MKKLKLVPGLIMLFSAGAQAAEPVVYVVRTGDTLSTIAQTQIGSPVFRKGDGSLFKLLKLNPTVSDAEFIVPGQGLVIRPTNEEGLAAVDESIPTPSIQKSSRHPTSAENVPQKTTAREIPHHLFLDTSMGLSTLTGTDVGSNTSATLYSSQDLGLKAGWQQDWSDSFSTNFSAQFRSVDFQPPTSSAKSLSDSKKFTTGLALGAESKLSSKFSLSYGASYNQELFLRALTTSSVGVDTLSVPKFSLGTIYQILESGKTSISASGHLDYLMGITTDGYSVSNGMAYQGGLYLKRRYGVDKSVQFSIDYRERAQNTSLVNFHEKTIFGTFVFSLPLFGESELK